MILRPFFKYFGGKHRGAYLYALPQYKTIVEPFCGSAGYALRHASSNVILIDKYPVVAGIWKYLTTVTADEILSLPDVHGKESVTDLPVCEAARDLIGFWLNTGVAMPGRTPANWMRKGTRPTEYWGPEVRACIAQQLPYIRHWQVIEGDYSDAPDIEATWFIDPPYMHAGKSYKHSSEAIDYGHLAEFCRSRRGQVMVCENEGATWLPFKPYIDIRSNRRKQDFRIESTEVSQEVVWENRGFSLFDEEE